MKESKLRLARTKTMSDLEGTYQKVMQQGGQRKPQEGEAAELSSEVYHGGLKK